MNDVGFSIAASAVTYWVGEAMHATDYKDLYETPEKTQRPTSMSVRDAVHLARLLAASQYSRRAVAPKKACCLAVSRSRDPAELEPIKEV